MAAETDNEKMEGPGIGAHSDALASRVGLRIPRLDLDAARRRALLVKMGKGTAALAVLAPLSVHASGTHKLYNPSLPGYGYCTVSGFQSAAVSGAAATVCSAYAPSHFLLTTEALTYNVLTGTNVNGVNKNNLAAALNTHFVLATDTISASTAGRPRVDNTLLGSPLAKLVVPQNNLVILPTTSNTGKALRGRNVPSLSLDPTGAFNSIFTNSTDGRTLLEVLYDGVLSSNPTSANCYFLSAYLTVFAATPNYLPAGFDKAYVTGQYSDGNAALGDVYLFFQSLCTTA